MVSMIETSNLTQNDEVMGNIASKSEPIHEASASSPVSTPEAETETLRQGVAQAQKRKGGRKPIYATSEERKQRNRQAQAAFRERRSEYIRQLETTIKRNEDALKSLQQSHRSAADECLMLRYKNSLLERILLEKGINVQAELRMRSASSGLVKQRQTLSKPVNWPSGGQRRQVGLAAKELPGTSQRRDAAYISFSQFQLPPSSVAPHKPSGLAAQEAMSPADHGQQTLPRTLPQHTNVDQPSLPIEIRQLKSDNPKPDVSDSTGSRPRGAPSVYYPSSFKRHYDQLEQEYNAQADLTDDKNDSVDDAPSYISTLPAPGSPGSRGVSNINSTPGDRSNGTYITADSILGNYDPMLDADPFGLSASMHFQTPFSYEQNNDRH